MSYGFVVCKLTWGQDSFSNATCQRVLVPCQMRSVLGQVAELVIELPKLGIPNKKITGVCFRPFFPSFKCLPLPFQRRSENLALPSAEQQALENVKAGLETWEYTARNTLMYYPTGEMRGSLRSGVGLGGLTPNGAYSTSVGD